MGKVDELLEIISVKTGMSREEIMLRVRTKQSELSDLVSEEGAAYIVANELGVKTRNRVIESILSLRELNPSMKSVNVMGRVRAIFGPREFTTKTGIKNKVVNMEIIDSTGIGRVVLWNMHDIEKIEKGIVSVGNVIKVKNGYVREGLNNRLEVHVGNKGLLIEKPEEYREDEFPQVAAGNIAISELQPNTPVSLAARVISKYEIKEFESNGRKGKVANAIINDGTASTRLVLWNENADMVNRFKEGDILKIENAFAKEGQRGVEIQANYSTKIKINPPGVSVSEQKREISKSPISGLKEGDFAELRAAVVSNFGENFVYEMCPACNKKIVFGKCEKCGQVNPNKLLILNLAIDDGSGTIRAALFRETAEKLIGMSTNDAAVDSAKVKYKLDSLLGTEKIFEGKIKHNAQFDRLEFSVYNIRDVNPAEEAQQIAEKIKVS